MVGEPYQTPTYAKVPVMRYPSVKTLLELTHHRSDRETALKVRKLLDGRTDPDPEGWRTVGQPGSTYSSQRGTKLGKLVAADKALGNHGVEWLAFECQHDEYHDPDGFYYSNAGDTYNATLVLYQGTYRVTTWGDMVEQHERRCAACRKRSREEYEANQ